MMLFATCSRTFLRKGEPKTACLCGLSLIVLPACLVSSGLGSKLSRWLTPPRIISQMTRFARGGKWGLPSGGTQPCTGSARSHAVAVEHRARGQADEAHADVGQEAPPRAAATGAVRLACSCMAIARFIGS